MVMGKMMKRYFIVILILFFFLLTGYFALMKAKSEIFVINESTILLLKPDWEYSSNNKILAQLQKGIIVELIHKRYSKDAMFYKIKTKDGLEGYIMWRPNLLLLK